MKKIISLILAIIILGTSVFATEEPNTPSDWAKESVEKAQALGIMEEGKDYNYTEAITREEFCELAFNMLVLCVGDCKCNGINPFSDVNNSAVSKLYEKGIIKGKSETEFAPNDFLTREEAAVILDRIYVALEIKMPSYVCFPINYRDAENCSDWAKDSVIKMGSVEIMSGVGEGNFAPKDTYTVEQAVTTLLRLYDSYLAWQDFAKRIISNAPGYENYVMSPLSIKMALALAANGADGETQKEILDLICVDDLEEFNEYAKNLIASYTETDIIRIDIANSVWINSSNTDQKFNEVYYNTVKDYYSAEAKEVTDKNAVETINDWTSEKTRGKIPQIIQSNDFTSMLINAVYFKADWMSQFSEENTAKGEFINIDGTTTEIDFMKRTSLFDYYEGENARIIELEYKSRDYIEDGDDYYPVEADMDVSMYVIVSKGDGLEALDTAINNDAFEIKKVIFSMPKFTIEYSEDLKSTLNRLGISEAFEEDAEFENMFDKGNTSLNGLFHKAYINVNEKGTEASAVTSATASASREEPIEFTVNQPFTFVVYDKTNDEILFIGEYVTAK